MAPRAIHLLVFDGFADWEPAHAVAELRRWGKRDVRTVGFSTEPVTSMGGVRVLPDLALCEVRPEGIELLILPGGEMWEHGQYPRHLLDVLATTLIDNGRPVAAICGATLALARMGALNERRHTSNAPEYLTSHAPEYTGDAFYVDAPAVSDDHVITASGLADVDFAREIFSALKVFSATDEALWFTMFKYGRLPDHIRAPA